MSGGGGSSSGARLVAVARLLGAHGLKGEVKLAPLTAEPLDAAAYGPLLDEAGALVMTPSRARQAKNHLIVRAEPFAEREAWNARRGLLLHVPRSALPELDGQAEDEGDEDDPEVYAADLEGLRVLSPEGAPLGRVRALLDHGAGEYLSIDADAGGEVLVPFTKEDVPALDLEAGTLVAANWALWSGAEDAAEPGAPQGQSGPHDAGGGGC